MKLEKRSTRVPQLLYEAKVYKLLAKGATGIPHVRSVRLLTTS
jgi:hypothetical protein